MGEGLFVEIDVVLDETMQLREAHDIGAATLALSACLPSSFARLTHHSQGNRFSLRSRHKTMSNVALFTWTMNIPSDTSLSLCSVSLTLSSLSLSSI